MAHFHTLPVAKVNKETADAVSISFKKPQDGSFDFLPGQYLTLKVTVQGQQVRRAYSLCSSPYSDPMLTVAVKAVEGGLVSTYLTSDLKEGDQIEVLAPMGNFKINPDPKRAVKYILFAGGSGITPIISMIKGVLEKEPLSKLILIYGSRSSSGIIFEQELKGLEQEAGGRLKIIHVLSQPNEGWMGLTGRIDRHKTLELVQEIANQDALENQFYMCGPAGMMEEISAGLAFLGVDKKSIHRELFTAKLPSEKESSTVSAPPKGRGVYDVKVILDGNESTLTVKPDQTLLEVVIQEGIDPPYACQLGICTTCRAKLISGEMEMEENEGLSDEEIEEGYVLTCQAHPLTEGCVVEFG